MSAMTDEERAARYFEYWKTANAALADAQDEIREMRSNGVFPVQHVIDDAEMAKRIWRIEAERDKDRDAMRRRIEVCPACDVSKDSGGEGCENCRGLRKRLECDR